MSTDTDLSDEFEKALADLPSVPATTYLDAGQRVRRRRRAARGVAAACAVALLGGAVATVVDDVGSSSTPVAAPVPGPDPDYVAPEPANPVEAVDGLEGVDHYTATTIPEWAEEHGNHGPVSIAPDGRLWVAPETTVLRTVVDPYAVGEGGGITASYAVEAESDGEVEWSLVYRKGEFVGGQMEDPGSWTTDFELWVDAATAHLQGRPPFAERLARFADDGSHRLVAGPGVEMVRQIDEIVVEPPTAQHPRITAAEVRWAGKTWYVVGKGPRHGQPWYKAFDPEVMAPDLEGFVGQVQDPTR